MSQFDSFWNQYDGQSSGKRPYSYDDIYGQANNEKEETEDERQLREYKEQGGGMAAGLERGLRTVNQTWNAAAAQLGDWVMSQTPESFQQSDFGQWLISQAEQDKQDVIDDQVAKQQLPQHPTMIRMMQEADEAETMPGAVGAAVSEFWRSPDKMGFVLDTLAEQVPVFASYAVGTKGAGNILGTANVATKAATFGVGGTAASITNTFGANVAEAMGVDTSKFDEATEQAWNRSLAQGIVDGIVHTAVPFKIGGRQTINIPVQALSQSIGAPLGAYAGNEAAGIESTKGELVMEGLLELLSTPTDIMMASMETFNQRKKPQEIESNQQLARQSAAEQGGSPVDQEIAASTAAVDTVLDEPAEAPEVNLSIEEELAKSNQEINQQLSDKNIADRVQEMREDFQYAKELRQLEIDRERQAQKDAQAAKNAILTTSDELLFPPPPVDLDPSVSATPKARYSQSGDASKTLGRRDEPQSNMLDQTLLADEEARTMRGVLEEISTPKAEPILDQYLDELEKPGSTEQPAANQQKPNRFLLRRNFFKNIYPDGAGLPKLKSDYALEGKTEDILAVIDQSLAQNRSPIPELQNRFTKEEAKNAVRNIPDQVRPVPTKEEPLKAPGIGSPVRPEILPNKKTETTTEDTGSERVSLIRKSNGEPFKTERSAQIAARSKKLMDYQIKSVDGGFEIQVTSKADQPDGTVSAETVTAQPETESTPAAPARILRAKEQGFNTEKVYYHGTASDFRAFSKKKATDREGRKLGMGWGKGKFYFADTGQAASSSAEFAEISGKGRQQNVVPVYLKMKNPIDADSYMKRVQGYIDNGKTRDQAIAKADKEIKREGYDGIASPDTGGYAVFEPSQIRSVNAQFDTDKQNEGDILFRLNDAPINKPLPRSIANNLTNKITKKWADKPVIADNFDALPDDVKQVADQYQAKPERVRGVYHNGKVYVVANNIGNRADLERTLFHEGYGHLGLRKRLGDDLKPTLRRLHKTIGGDTGFQKLAKQHNVDLSAYAEGLKTMAEDEKNLVMMDELLAHIAEQNKPGIKLAVREFFAKVKAWLRNNGFIKLSEGSDTDVINLLREAREAVQKADTTVNKQTLFSYEAGIKSYPYNAGYELFHGTSSDNYEEIRKTKKLIGPVYLTPRMDVAEEYSGDGKVIKVNIDKGSILIDFDLAGGKLLNVEEANNYSGNNWDLGDYINAGYSLGTNEDIFLNDNSFSTDSILFSLTPEDKESMRKVGLSDAESADLIKDVQKVYKKLGNLSWWEQLKERAYEGVLDGLIGIKRAEDAAGVTDMKKSGYVGARLATGVADTMHAVMHYGAPRWRNGVLQKKPGTEGLMNILESVGKDLNDFLAWVAGHRAQELLEQGRENNLTQEDIDRLIGRGRGKEDQFRNTMEKYRTLNKAMLDMAQGAGLIDGNSRKKWESKWYIPFYRNQMDEDEVTLLGPRTKRGLSHQTSGIKKLVGGDMPTNDLLENILANWIKLTDASMKNMALIKTTKNLESSPDFLEEMNKGERKDKKDVIRVMYGGKEKYYRVNDAPLLRAVTHFQSQGFTDPVTRAGRFLKRLLTTGVTVSPDFMARNFVRDGAHAWAINPDDFKFGEDTFKGLKNALKEDGDYRELMFSGASFQGGYVHATDPDASAQIVRRALDKRGLSASKIDQYINSLIHTNTHLASTIEKGWQKYREIGDKVENANRLATYKAAKAKGKSTLQAAFEAKDLMDYSLRGNFQAMIWFTDVIPFLNARAQGLSKLGRVGLGENKAARKQLLVAGAKLAAFSWILAALNGDDERYKELPDWDKDINWHIFLGDEHFRIPKPFEIGILFGTMPERVWHTMAGNQENEKLWWSFKHNLLQTMSINPIPQAVLPIWEATANRSFFFDRPIEGMADEGKLEEARYDEGRTSMTMRILGDWLGMSPKKLEHVYNGYTGTMGMYLLGLVDIGADYLTDQPKRPARSINQFPVIKSFYRGDGPAKSTQYSTDFYDRLKEVDQLYRTIREYRLEGRTEDAQELFKDNKEKLKYRRQLGKARQQLGQIKKRMEMIQRSRSMSADEKSDKLERLTEQRNGITRKYAELTNEAF